MKISNKQKYLIINFFGAYDLKAIGLELFITIAVITILIKDLKLAIFLLLVIVFVFFIAYKPIGFAMKIGRFDKKLSIHKLPFVNFNKAFAKSLNILKNKIKKVK